MGPFVSRLITIYQLYQLWDQHSSFNIRVFGMTSDPLEISKSGFSSFFPSLLCYEWQKPWILMWGFLLSRPYTAHGFGTHSGVSGQQRGFSEGTGLFENDFGAHMPC